MVSSLRKQDVSNQILVLDPLPLKTLKTLRLQHVCNRATQRRRNFPLLMLDVYASVQTHFLLQILFQILSTIIFELENQGRGENVEATLCVCPSVCRILQSIFIILDQAFKLASHQSLNSLSVFS